MGRSASQVFLFTGTIDVRDAGALQKTFVATSGSGAKMAFAMGAAPAAFVDVTPGPYSVCMIPITGDMSDPQFMKRLQDAAMTLAVHCRPLAVAATPAEQQASFAIPPMSPLP